MEALAIHLILTSLWVGFGLEATDRSARRFLQFAKDSLGFGRAQAKLEMELREIIYGIDSVKLNDLPVYKFYHRLILLLNEQKIQMGIDITPALSELLQALARDRKFSKKVKTAFESSLAQFLLVCAITWIFHFFINYLLSLYLSPSDLRILGLLQVTGLISFIAVFCLSFRQFFKYYPQLLELFYVCRSLWSANFPINQITHRLGTIALPTNKKFGHHLNKYQQLMELGQRYGTVADKDFDSLINGVWDQMEWEFEQFTKALILIKFLHLVLFFVPSYFLLLYFLLEKLHF